MKDLLGIDIGAGNIRFVTKNNYYVIQTPENALKDGEVIAFDGLSETIKDAVREYGIRERNVAFTLPDASVYQNRFTMPYMSIKQLEFNLPFEFKDVLQGDKTDYVYDYALISHDDKEMELFAAAVDKTLLEKYKEMFKKAGLKLVKCTCKQMAVTDLLRKHSITEDVALVDLGYAYTTIDIYKEGFYDTSRRIESGLNDLIKAVSEILYCDEHIAREYLFSNKDNVQQNSKLVDLYDSIAVQVSRSLNFYGYENPNNSLSNLYVYGSGAPITPFIEAIRQNVSIDVQTMNHLFNEDDQVYVDALNACGASRG